ncbi:hypothetical protein L6164_037164 [Bauhinia variegata]|uniref:Uncharacterized protein n=1 Tax=Bauhinia variegata TaxID=167791 RepID=A0ACB9KJD1_BAUVA|nr:hypothetical protein L6164_037164 [Bauhinia variegata]
MDFVFQPILLISIILILSTYFIHKRKPNKPKKLPPGSFGWPLLGETHQFLFKRIDHFLEERKKKYSSDIFKTNVLGEPTVVFSGPAGNKFISMNEPKFVKAYYLKTQRRFFNLPEPDNRSPHPAMSKQGAAAAVQILGFLKPEGLTRYMAQIESITQQHLTAYWEGKDELQVYPLVKIFVLTLVHQFYLGLNDPDRAAKFVNNFDNLHFGIHSIPMNLPGTKYYHALKGVAAIRDEIQCMIKEKIEGFSKGFGMEDLIGHVIAAEHAGKFVPTIEICNIIMGLMHGSYTSVVTTLAFMIKHIGQQPDIYHKILSEHTDISKSKGTDSALDWASIQKMKYTWAVAEEAMRLYPPAAGPFREAVTDINHAGLTIPKGWKIFWAITATNKNPMFFPDPEIFDPSRFLGNGPAPYTYIPFGSGPRTCPGKDYTRFVVLTFIHHLVTKFKWEVTFPDEKISGVMVPIPSKGIPIRLQQL